MTALGVPSMHQETISRIELGQRPLSLAEAEVLTWILGIELSDLLTGIDGAAVEAEVREAEEALARARERLESLKR